MDELDTYEFSDRVAVVAVTETTVDILSKTTPVQSIAKLVKEKPDLSAAVLTRLCLVADQIEHADFPSEIAAFSLLLSLHLAQSQDQYPAAQRLLALPGATLVHRLVHTVMQKHSDFAVVKQPKSHGGEINVADHLGEVIQAACGENPVWLSDLRARIEMAQAKYGQPLLTHDGRDGLVDLIQELYDAMNYAVKVTLAEDSRIASKLPEVLVALTALTDCVYRALNNSAPPE
jgi:hypothetical protein